MSRMIEDPRLAEAQALSVADTGVRLNLTLRRAGHEWVGPCPDCGGDDRFAISVPKNVFNCRKCGAKGDAIALVMLALACDFPAALAWLCGERDQVLDPAEASRRRARAEADRQKREREAERYRSEAIAAARRIWNESWPARRVSIGLGPAAYLACRGIDLPGLPESLPACLRYHADLPYMVAAAERGQWRMIWSGPAMVAAVQGQDDRFCAVHRTWIDLSRPKGKPLILDGDRICKTKESRGSIKGGAIRLHTARDSGVLVMGEGIETTATAWCYGRSDWSYWAGVSLGNMAGRRESGPGLKFAGRPDMADREAFVPPAWVRRLIFIQDGDSEPQLTRAQLLSGLRRAMALRPGLTGAIVHAGEGRDLNDVVMEVPGDE